MGSYRIWRSVQLARPSFIKLFYLLIKNSSRKAHKISFQDVPTTKTISWNCCHRWLEFCGCASDGKIHHLVQKQEIIFCLHSKHSFADRKDERRHQKLISVLSPLSSRQDRFSLFVVDQKLLIQDEPNVSVHASEVWCRSERKSQWMNSKYWKWVPRACDGGLCTFTSLIS
jgi:hypothetical protein